jgi:hypothetical protein
VAGAGGGGGGAPPPRCASRPVRPVAPPSEGARGLVSIDCTICTWEVVVATAPALPAVPPKSGPWCASHAQLTLRYFTCRGRGQALRFMLADSGQEWTNVVVPLVTEGPVWAQTVKPVGVTASHRSFVGWPTSPGVMRHPRFLSNSAAYCGEGTSAQQPTAANPADLPLAFHVQVQHVMQREPLAGTARRPYVGRARGVVCMSELWYRQDVAQSGPFGTLPALQVSSAIGRPASTLAGGPELAASAGSTVRSQRASMRCAMRACVRVCMRGVA